MPKVNNSYFEEKKQFILNSATELINSNGIECITMSDLIRKTGLSQGGIYKYFKNLNEILSVIICNFMNEMKKMISDCVSNYVSFDLCYENICNGMVKLHSDSPEIFKAMMGEVAYNKTPESDDDILYRIYTVGEEINNILAELIKRGVDDGVLKDNLNYYVVIFYMWSGIGQTIVFSYSKRKYIFRQFGMTRDEYMKQSFELIVSSIKK